MIRPDIQRYRVNGGVCALVSDAHMPPITGEATEASPCIIVENHSGDHKSLRYWRGC